MCLWSLRVCVSVAHTHAYIRTCYASTCGSGCNTYSAYILYYMHDRVFVCVCMCIIALCNITICMCVCACVAASASTVCACACIRRCATRELRAVCTCATAQRYLALMPHIRIVCMCVAGWLLARMEEPAACLCVSKRGANSRNLQPLLMMTTTDVDVCAALDGSESPSHQCSGTMKCPNDMPERN